MSGNNTNLTTVETTEISELPWMVSIYFLVVFSGNFVNLFNIIALICCKKNGLLSVILQISLIDFLSVFVITLEIITLEKQSWIFSNELCQLFRGFEILFNSLIIYLMVCFNFHVISLWNLYEYQMNKTTKNPLTSTDKDCSNECLINKNDTTRNINYLKAKSNISVIFPTIFVWFVCISISIPDFTLSTSLTITNTTLCAIIDVYHGQLAQYLLICFKLVIPLVLLMITIILLLIKFKKKQQDLNNLLLKKIVEIKLLAKLAISLTILFLLTSSQRYILQFLHVITYQFTDNHNFKMPPLYNNYLNNTMLYFAMLHYSSCIIRGVLYIMILPKFRLLIRTKFCCCCCKVN